MGWQNPAHVKCLPWVALTSRARWASVLWICIRVLRGEMFPAFLLCCVRPGKKERKKEDLYGTSGKRRVRRRWNLNILDTAWFTKALWAPTTSLGEALYLLVSLQRSRCPPTSETWETACESQVQGNSLGRPCESVLAEAISSQQAGVRDLGEWEQVPYWSNSQLEVRA